KSPRRTCGKTAATSQNSPASRSACASSCRTRTCIRIASRSSGGKWPLKSSLRRHFPASPVREVVRVRRAALGTLFEPGFRLRDKLLFVFELELSQRHPAAEEAEVRVEDVTTAVVVDFLGSPGVVHVLHLRAVDPGFARLANQ